MLLEQEKLIEKARKSLATAKQLNDAGYPESEVEVQEYIKQAEDFLNLSIILIDSL